jgi:hypothetical protein
MPAIRRATLCTKHAKGEREDDEANIRPPAGSSQCSVCRAEVAHAVAVRESGTMSHSGLVSAYAPDDDFPVKSPQARARIAALRAQQQQVRSDEDAAVADLDAARPDLIEFERAPAGAERVDTYRRQDGLKSIRAMRRAATGPRWETT